MNVNDFPKVTLILPIHNEENFIRSCLESILNQDYPPDKIEVLVVDGMSTDSSLEMAGNLLKDRLSFRCINNPKKIVSTGLNLAIPQAKGDFILRIDGHTHIAPDYLMQCVYAYWRSGAENVGGRMNAQGIGFFGETVAYATSMPFGVGGSRFHYSDKEEWVDSVYMGAWPRKVFNNIGLFDEELVRDQDDEFNYRLRQAGGKILLSPRIRSHYTVRSSPKALWKQYFQYGLWKVRVLQKHSRQMSLRQFVPPAFALAVVLSFLAAVLWLEGRLLLAVVLGSYGLANLTASILTARQHGWRYLTLMPMCFVILHLSYGLGFLVGLIKFWNRWNDKVGNVPGFNSTNVRIK